MFGQFGMMCFKHLDSWKVSFIASKCKRYIKDKKVNCYDIRKFSFPLWSQRCSLFSWVNKVFVITVQKRHQEG